MNHFNIHCNYCDAKAIIKNGKIKMNCICDDEFRIIELNEHIEGKYEDYLYTMFNDNFEYIGAK